MIPSPGAVQFVLDVLNESGIPYFITGSLVTSAYGQPRATADADFVVDVRAHSIAPILQRLRSKLAAEEQLSFETVTARTTYRLRDPATGFVIELFEMEDDPHDISRLARRSRREYLGRHAYFPTVEDAVITKLRWLKQLNRNKDRLDLATVITRMANKIDWSYVEYWCSQHSTLGLLATIRDGIERQ